MFLPRSINFVKFLTLLVSTFLNFVGLRTEMASHNACSYCGSQMRISKLTCEGCGLAHEGEFFNPRLYRLSAEEQHFVELFVLASGSLKQTASLLGISYPTVRNRLDRLMERLKEEQAKDEKRKQRILEDMEAGRLPPKKGMRMIENL